MISPNDQRLVSLLKGQADVLQEVSEILAEEQKKDDVLHAVVLSSRSHRTNTIRGLDPARIFHVDDIRQCCIKYRLRFLPAAHFKGPLPTQALYALSRVEARADAPLAGFMVMAPAMRFRLCDCDADPLLFVPVEEDCFYLVYRWGSDMKPWRAALGWPVRNWKNLAVTVVALAWIIAALMPTPFITRDPAATWWGPHRIFAMFWTTVLGFAATAFSWYTFFGQFSEDAWNSKTFN